ncbi:MAG: DMT family transporter, partial [Planctomycetota bacterium]
MKDNLHLLIPFLGSFLFVGGLIASKSASQRGVSSSAVSLATNLICSIAFIPFWFFGGEVPETNLWWQPIICATLFMVGMAFTYASVSVGDVSVASPVFGIKVLLVTIVLAIATQKMPSNALWIASAMATSGVVIVQWTGVGDAKNTALTILLASLAACCYAVLDVLIQTWSQSWGTGRLLPIMFLIVGLLSLPLLLRIDWKPIRTKAGASVLLLAAILMTGQVISIVGTLSLFG